MVVKLDKAKSMSALSKLSFGTNISKVLWRSKEGLCVTPRKDAALLVESVTCSVQ